MSNFLPALGEKVVVRGVLAIAGKRIPRTERRGEVVGFGFKADTAIVTLNAGTIEVKYDLLQSLAEAEWLEYRNTAKRTLGHRVEARREFLAGWNAREAA